MRAQSAFGLVVTIRIQQSGNISGPPFDHQCHRQSLNVRDNIQPSTFYEDLNSAIGSARSGRDGALAR
jgi:hypothetical protein